MIQLSPNGFQIVIVVFSGIRTCTVSACSTDANALPGSYDGKYVANTRGSPFREIGLPFRELPAIEVFAARAAAGRAERAEAMIAAARLRLEELHRPSIARRRR